MSCFGNGAVLNGGEDGATVLFGVGALGVAALPDVRLELPKGQGEIFFFKKVEAFEIEHGKAGRVSKVATIGFGTQSVQFCYTCGVFSAFDAAADLSRLQL